MMERPEPKIGPIPFILTTILIGAALIAGLYVMWVKMDGEYASLEKWDNAPR